MKEKGHISFNFWRRLRRKSTYRWSIRFLTVLIFLALFADFLANDKPLYGRWQGKAYFPVLIETGVEWGVDRWPEGLSGLDWYAQDYEQVVWPLIPYASTTLDNQNMNFRAPLGEQNLRNWRFRHWLGTDRIGRDVAAGLIHGTRTALLTGFVAMGLAFGLGAFFGLLAGYYGDTGLRCSRRFGFRMGFALLLSLAWLITPGLDPWRETPAGFLSPEKIILPLVWLGVGAYVVRTYPRGSWWDKKFSFPVDRWVLRLIEVIQSIPTLFFLLAGIAILPNRSLGWVMLWIGLLSWTGVARFIRAETLKVREENYAEAARFLGISSSRVLVRHILPNAIRPVFIVLAFGFAGVILLEAYLSYLGLGAAPDEVSWGSMIRMAADRPGAWWMAVFPGLALFFTLGACNLLGEGLSETWSGS
jgi:peptide/nickel transport system permease protein